MLPSVVASELREAIEQFLQNAFPFSNPAFQQTDHGLEATALVDGLTAQEGALFKGPYLDIKLPFRTTDEEPPFKQVHLPFKPFAHQQRAFNRLTGENVRSTIVATGTGSGKTECFLLPALEDAVNRPGPGIKTIIIYPMNALAADQARRFAREAAALDAKVSVGMFVGGQKGAAVSDHMGDDYVITDHDTLRKNPPDILLTNYKMLDFLLIRPEDQELWRFNEPGTLRYLVVDELHTFDGAQGTDLACLIRRLRDRLGAGNELACIGTSATMGSDGATDLQDYASTIFATEFDDESIVQEDRLSVDEYLGHHSGGSSASFATWPTQDIELLEPYDYASQEAYLAAQARAWFGEEESWVQDFVNEDPRVVAQAKVTLGEKLLEHQAFRDLLSAGTGLVDVVALTEDWQYRFGIKQSEVVERLIMSLVALIAGARLWNRAESEEERHWTKPFLYVRQQIWLRELSRMVSSVPASPEEPPQLAFSDDLPSLSEPLHLPLIHCRNCHLGAWGASVEPGGGQKLSGSLQGFYQNWFSKSHHVRLIVPLEEDQEPPHGERKQYFCPRCVSVQAGKDICTSCDSKMLHIWLPDMTTDVKRNGATRSVLSNQCPQCEARGTLAIVGYRAASLISAMVGKLFGTPYNDDHKLIAFSDSVQDAAHRSGFLGANSWRFLLRQAFANWLADTGETTIAEMRDALPEFWKAELGTPERFVGTFTPPDLTYLWDYQALERDRRLSNNASIVDEVTLRLRWEIVSEFTLRSTIGRSLERAETAAIGLDLERLRTDVSDFLANAREHIEVLRHTSEQSMFQFVLGLLHHARHRGAVYAPELNSYLSENGSRFMLQRSRWMPRVGRHQAVPAALTLDDVSSDFEALIGKSRTSWSVRFLQKNLASEDLLIATDARELFRLLLNSLTQAGWLKHFPSNRDNDLYLLQPERLRVSPHSASARCNECQQSVYFTPDMADAYEGMPCLRAHCSGELHVAESKKLPMYTRTRPHRLVPHEHTGLLERDVREAVEESFINGREPWDYNLLSATPTLEMGIDIGDLSTVFLCSVPPNQANYVQRIGRAGRRGGNSLAVTVANGRNHDLYFYADPVEMMDGNIATPGVFLQAHAVLERQLVAFCLDNWVRDPSQSPSIPRKMSQVLNASENAGVREFPWTFFEYVSSQADALAARFFGLFPELDEDAQAYLREYLRPNHEGSLESRVLLRLHQMNQDRRSFQRQARKLATDIKAEEALPKDEARDHRIREMRNERNALLGLVKWINQHHTLNFLTDEGLLPNYAFPEEGVTLQSVILRSRERTETSDGDELEELSYQFQRPAQAALGELAPEATFYALSRKLTIDRVDLTASEPQWWRFCDRCHHTEDVTVSDVHRVCPNCGSPQWQDANQKHEVLRLRQVFSTVFDRRSRISDDSEQRDPKFFNRQMLVDIPSKQPRTGWRITTPAVPFGFEYVPRTTLREVNFGEMSQEGARTFSVAGEEYGRRGFKLCRHCGTVQKRFRERHERLHTFTCKLSGHEGETPPEDLLESLYLYREVESESIRILLPISGVAESTIGLDSFVAALNLGLRLYFKGNVDHIQVTAMKEPATRDSGEKTFLVIYDSIPGGTGYLKELLRDPNNIFDLLQHAYEHITMCACNEDPDADGCYRCVLRYRDSRKHDSISRNAAASLLRSIIAERANIEPTQSLSNVSTSTLIESELEKRFIEELRAIPNAKLTHEIYQGKPGHVLTLPGEDGRPMAWHVEHQHEFRTANTMDASSVIDVLLTPTGRASASQRPIAIFMDGYQYHRDIVHQDARKRAAILASGKYWVITLGWHDLPANKEDGREVAPGVFENRSPREAMFRQYVPKNWKSSPPPSFHLLHELLSNPIGECELEEWAMYRAFTWLAVNTPTLSFEELALFTPTEALDDLYVDDTVKMLGAYNAAAGASDDLLGLVVSVQQRHFNTFDTEDPDVPALSPHIRSHLWFDDDNEIERDDRFESAWRSYWHAVNVLQFLPGFTFATKQAVADGLGDVRQPPRETGENEIDVAWHEVLTLSLLEPETIMAVMELGVSVPEAGVDIANPDGTVAFNAELLWRDAQVAVVLDPISGPPDGWVILEATDDLLPQLTHLIEKGALS